MNLQKVLLDLATIDDVTAGVDAVCLKSHFAFPLANFLSVVVCHHRARRLRTRKEAGVRARRNLLLNYLIFYELT